MCDRHTDPAKDRVELRGLLLYNKTELNRNQTNSGNLLNVDSY